MDADFLPHAGKLAALLASLIWSCSISIYKVHGQGVPAQTLNLYKLVVALTGFTAIYLGLHVHAWMYDPIKAPIFPVTWEKSGWLMLSGVIGLTLGDTLFFVSIRRLGAALTSAIQCLTPPLNATIDWLYLNKPMTTLQIIGMVVIVVSVAGVILTGAPAQDDEKKARRWTMGLLAALGSACSSAAAYAVTGELIKNENVFACTILRIMPALGVLIAFAVFTSSGREGIRILSGHPKKAGYLALAATLGAVIGLSLQGFAFQHADTGIVSTLSTTYPIWVIPVAAYFLKEHPTFLQICCTIFAIVGIALLMLPPGFWISWLP